MSWLLMCPGCGKLFEIDDNGKSVSNAKYKFINETICENCGRDMIASIKHAVDVIIPDIYKQKYKYKNPPQR